MEIIKTNSEWLIICLANVVCWKLNQFGMVNLTNVLVDMCLTKILVKYIGYVFNHCDWLETLPTRIDQFDQYIGRCVQHIYWLNRLVICLTNVIGWKHDPSRHTTKYRGG